MKIQRDTIQPLGIHNPAYPCVRTSCAEHLVKYPFTHFNPPQSEFCEILYDDCNIGVFWPTAAGKTVAMELANAKTLSEGKVCLNLFPLKALTEEKLMDWTDESHTFSSKKIVPITGDYVLTEYKRQQLMEADIIVATSEMLDSKTRNYAGNPWLNRIDLLVVDEAHLIGSESRGPRLESAILRFCENNKNARIVIMSATVPNKIEICEWLETVTGKITKVVESDYRPCVLNKTFVRFDDHGAVKRRRYDKVEELRMKACYAQILKNINDQHLVFTGPKTWGYRFKDFLNKYGISAEFHNADLPKEKRREFENKFRSGEIHILISTSTLSWGCNLPARRVILAHTAYGVTPMEVCDIEQAQGRSGRPKYDNVGDAYTLIPMDGYEKEVVRITKGFQVMSHIHEIPNLAFHAVSEISSETIKTKNCFKRWYEKTLAYTQGFRLSEEDCDNVFQLLEEKKMIKKYFDRNGSECYEATTLGKIASSMYMNPLDVYDWFINFANINEINVSSKTGNIDARKINKDVSLALASCYEYKKSKQYCSKAESATYNVTKFQELIGKKPDGVLKIAACYYAMLNGDNIDLPLKSISEGLKLDLQRVLATIKMVHNRYGSSIEKLPGYKYSDKEWDALYFRIIYGVKKELIPLVSIPGIGREFSRKLFDKNIKNFKSFINKPNDAIEVLGKKRYDNIISQINQKNGK